MRRHLAAIAALDPAWEYTPTGYLAAGYRLERWPGNRWTITEATSGFASLGDAINWIAANKRGT